MKSEYERRIVVVVPVVVAVVIIVVVVVVGTEKASETRRRCLIAFIGIIKRAEEGGQEGEICLNYSN